MDKWNTLTHNGPIFPPEYEYKKYKIYVNNKEYILSKEAEEVMTFWVQKIETPYIQDKICIKNYWSDFKKLLPIELQKSSFPKDWDFKEVKAELDFIKEQKKNRTKEEKAIIKKDSLERKEKYGFAKLDGEKTPLGNYMIEPPGLFMGRGQHPLRFRVKPRIKPEDVTINHSLHLDPPSPPEGCRWKEVVENKNSYFTVGWIDKLTGKFKPILFSATSSVSHESAKKKFTKAIELANNFNKVNEFIEKKLRSRDKTTRQIATVCELISKMSIRVGDEKSSDEADTRGATTICIENVKINGKFLNELKKEDLE